MTGIFHLQKKEKITIFCALQFSIHLILSKDKNTVTFYGRGAKRNLTIFYATSLFDAWIHLLVIDSQVDLVVPGAAVCFFATHIADKTLHKQSTKRKSFH